MIKYQRLYNCSTFETKSCYSLRDGRLKGKGKEVLGARETPGAREEGGKETPARRTLYFSFVTSTRRMLKSCLVSLQNMSITVLIPLSDWLKSTLGY